VEPVKARRTKGPAGAVCGKPGLTATACATLIAAVLAVTGCAGDDGNGGNRATVVATTTQVADIVRAVGGDRIRTETLLSAGADPHEYEPRPSDARALAGARLVVRSGGDVDAWLAGLIDSTGSNARVVTASDSVDAIADDPHWWQDPQAATRVTLAIRAALARSDPAGADEYRRRADGYLARLRRLDAGIAKCVERLPPERRKLVTTHDSLGYFARRYGFQVIGAAIPSRSTQAQPSAAATARLVEQIKREGVPVIFPESSLDPKLERAIARDAGAEVGGELWADSLGPEDSSGATYLDSLASNAQTIVGGLSEGRISCELDVPGAAS
jgi:ABC-type Zn uptake system ZnuABC Zn-binding protein ZnuA